MINLDSVQCWHSAVYLKMSVTDVYAVCVNLRREWLGAHEWRKPGSLLDIAEQRVETELWTSLKTLDKFSLSITGVLATSGSLSV